MHDSFNTFMNSVMDFLFDHFTTIIISIIDAWIISIVVALFALLKDEWKSKAITYLQWALMPFLLFGNNTLTIGKRCLLFIFSPMITGGICFVAFLCLLFVAVYGYDEYVPASIDYHNAADLKRITSVDFPEVTPVDSLYNQDGLVYQVTIKFVPIKPLTKRFFQRLDRACRTDSCCWNKNDNGYRYFIFPEYPVNRSAGTHIRQVQGVDGEMVNDWDGDFIEVIVPLKGDTIIVNDGWCR